MLPSHSHAGISNPRTVYVAAGIVALAAIVAYSNSFTVPLLLDDFGAIAGNPTIQRLPALDAVLQPPSHVGTAGRPFANFTFALNYAFGGLDVRSYHVVNLAIHILAGLTLFGLARRTLLLLPGTTSAPSTFCTRLAANALPLSLSIAALWSLHPMQTVSVTYLSQRTESLMGLCYLLTLYAFVRSREGSPTKWFIMSVVACALGMGAKEVMVTAPVAVLLYDRTFVAGSFRQALLQRGRYYAALAATWILLAVLLQGDLHERQVGFGYGVPWWKYALTECEAILTYARLAVWPGSLVFDYGPAFRETLRDAAPFAVPLAALLGLTGFALHRYPKVGFCAACFFLVLAPTSSVVPVALQPIAENRAYLPLAAILSMVVLGVHWAMGRRSPIVFSMIALAFVGLTFKRNQLFSAPLTLAADTIAKRPLNPRTYDSYGQTLKETGRPADAVPYLERAISLNPKSAASHAILADCFLALERYDDAASFYARALERDPRVASARINYGVVFLRTGRLADAIVQFEHVLRDNPANVIAHRNLAAVYKATGRTDDAVRHYQEAIRLDPSDAGIHYDFAALLAARANWSLAEKHYGEALRLRPNWAEAYNGYGAAIFNSGRFNEGIAHIERALVLNPELTDAKNNLARVRAAQAKAP